MSKKTVTIKHYQSMTNDICISDFVWCLAHTRRQAIAIYSSLRMIFEWHKYTVDEYYIKEKINISKDASDVYIIDAEIRKRILEWKLSNEEFLSKKKEEEEKWDLVFKFEI